MQVEKSLCGEYLNVQIKTREGELLHSFLEFFLRNKLSEEIVTNEEYEVVQKLSDEISLYLEDDFSTYEEVLTVEKLLNEYKGEVR